MSDNFCYRKVGRAITKWGAIEKIGNKNYFADCTNTFR